VPNIGVLPEPEAAAVVAVDELVLDAELGRRLLPHPAATKPATTTTTKPDRPVTRSIGIPPGVGEALRCVEALLLLKLSCC
jgi:hypothetical protein